MAMPKAKGAMDMGLSQAWDVKELRDRLRAGSRLVVDTAGRNFVCSSDANVKCNLAVIAPVIQLLQNSKVLGIDIIAANVSEIYEACKKERDATVIHQESWAVKRLAQFINSKASKKRGSRAAALEFFLFV